ECEVSGESFIRFLVKKDDNGKYSLKLHVIEAERIDESKTDLKPRENGNQIFRGIELDKDGNRVAYHVLKNNPKHPMTLGDLTTEEIPADQMLHLYIADRPGQLRGV